MLLLIQLMWKPSYVPECIKGIFIITESNGKFGLLNSVQKNRSAFAKILVPLEGSVSVIQQNFVQLDMYLARAVWICQYIIFNNQ